MWFPIPLALIIFLSDVLIVKIEGIVVHVWRPEMNFGWGYPLLAVSFLSSSCYCLRSAARWILWGNHLLQESVLRSCFFLFRISRCLEASGILFGVNIRYGCLIVSITACLPSVTIETNSLQGCFVWYRYFQLPLVHNLLSICTSSFYRFKSIPICLIILTAPALLINDLLRLGRQPDMILQQDWIHDIRTLLTRDDGRSCEHISLCFEAHLSLSLVAYISWDHHLLIFFVTTSW